MTDDVPYVLTDADVSALPAITDQPAIVAGYVIDGRVHLVLSNGRVLAATGLDDITPF